MDPVIIGLATACFGLLIIAVWILLAYRTARISRAILQDELNVYEVRKLQSDENEERLRKIIETEPECVKIQERDGTIVEMNPAGLSLVEANCPSEVIGNTVFNFVAPEFHEDYRMLTDRVFNGESAVLEFQIVSMKNRRLWMETNAAPLKDAKGNVIALLAITRDISARKIYEHQLQLESRDLAHSLRLHTIAELATMLAHELNQPLTAIQNYSRGCLLRMHPGKPAEELRGAIEEMGTQAERAASIIRSMREFTSKEEPRHAVVSVNDIVENALRFAEIEARTANVKVEKQLHSDLPQVSGNKIQLEQVMLNIIRNGIEAMETCPDHERALSVRTEEGSAGAVRVIIRDSGVSDTQLDLSKFFMPFYTTKSQGMGMGLAISSSIVEAHGGSVAAALNEAGAGVTVTVELPGQAMDWKNERPQMYA